MGKNDYPAPSRLEITLIVCGMSGQLLGAGYFIQGALEFSSKYSHSIDSLMEPSLGLMAASVLFGTYSRFLEKNTRKAYVQKLKDLGYKLE